MTPVQYGNHLQQTKAHKKELEISLRSPVQGICMFFHEIS